MKRVVAWSSVGLLAMAVFAQVALAGSATQRKADADDSAGAIDLARVSLGYASGEFTVTIRGHERWGNRKLRGPKTMITTRLSRRDSSEPRRLLTIDYRKGSLVAKIENTAKGAPAPVIARPDPTRPDRKTVRVVFDREDWGRLGKRIFWGVSVDGPCSDCFDSAPDDGSYFRYRF